MDERLRSKYLAVFSDAFAETYLAPRPLTAADVPGLARPFQWWNDIELAFDELEQQMRGVMARMLAILSLHAPSEGGPAPTEVEELAVGVHFIDGYINRQEIELPESTNPTRALRAACEAARSLLGEDAPPVLPRVPEMQTFHEGWRGILPDEVIALDDRAALDQLAATCAEVLVLENFVFNVLRRSGREVLGALDDALTELLPADQVLWLHGLAGFVGDAEVIGLYERVIAGVDSDLVRDMTKEYLGRVRPGGAQNDFGPN
ncbi:MAG: hypothetical protein JWP97_3664 [Labilithrix sp.]|nr:hypothetical protein [Labilithrix sp.]